MKKVILSIGLMVCVAIGANAQETTTPNPVNPNAAKFKFESELVDYGTIEHNADGNREFKFTNVGKEPLIISNAVGSCGCTTPVWPKEPIKPGASGVIKVHYATDRVGQFEKTVTLTSNADTPSKVLKIKGVVKPDATPAATPAPVTPTEQKH
ncbi:MAG: DUF1573 domain-containing protein [Bacteroidetes bacterium]|nr:DUF1573 domain-containing protein [Bacteroidota bacterium]